MNFTKSQLSPNDLQAHYYSNKAYSPYCMGFIYKPCSDKKGLNAFL